MIRLALALVLAAATWARADDPCATTVGFVSGTVRDAGGQPLAGAHVRVQGCLGGAVDTDAAGAFQLAVPATASIVAAAADGHYIGCSKAGTSDCVPVNAGAAGLTITLDPTPTDDDPAYLFRSPTTCQVCHDEIFSQWSRSSMAVTNRNRWVDNLYNGTDIAMSPGLPADPLNPPYFGFLASHVRRNPDGSPKLGSGGSPDFRFGECANCHQPEFVGSAPTNTNFNLYTQPGGHAVTCEFCHKITDVDVSADGIRRPNLVVGDHGLPAKTTMQRSPTEPWLVFGPLEDATFDGGTMMRASHATVVTSSKICAPCHEDHADTRDTNDDFTERYDGPPSQTTYSEWAASSWAARGVQCQDCHMQPSGGNQICNRAPVPRDPSQVRSHEFPGTTPEFLRSAVTLRAHSRVDGGQLAVRVDLTNSGAGHDVPTGVTLRHLILVVTPKTKDGSILEQLSQGGGPHVPDWGGAGDRAQNNFAGLPGKGYARVLVDENLVENVLFTEAVGVYDNRIAAGATDTTTYRFPLPKDWAKQDVRVETQLWYRRAFKPIADQRKWTTPMNGNPHGTRGDGTDYDGGLVIAERTNRLTCRGRLAKVAVTADPAAGTLVAKGAFKLPAHTTIDPLHDGAQVTAGVADAESLAVDAPLTGLVNDGTAIAYAGAAGDPVQSLRLTPAGKRAYKVALSLRGLPADMLGQTRLELGLESGDVCGRKIVRCKRRGATVRCR